MRGRHSFGHGFDLQVLFYPPRTAPDLPVTAGVGLGFWVVPSSHMLKTEFLCHFSGKGFFHLKKKHFEISPLKPLNGVQL